MSDPEYPWRKDPVSRYLRSDDIEPERIRKRTDERDRESQPSEAVRDVPVPTPDLHYVTSTDCRVCGKGRSWWLWRLYGFGRRRHCGQCGAEYCRDCFLSLPIDYVDPNGSWWIRLCAECDGETVDFYRSRLKAFYTDWWAE